MNQSQILVLCTGNSCRSQMAHGYLKYFFEDEAIIFSAGVETHGVNPIAIKSMLEDHVDISMHTSNLIDEYVEVDFDLIITVCDNAKERCPYFPSSAKMIHHNFKDPSKIKGTEEEIMTAFREVRSEIKEFCRELYLNYADL